MWAWVSVGKERIAGGDMGLCNDLKMILILEKEETDEKDRLKFAKNRNLCNSMLHLVLFIVVLFLIFMDRIQTPPTTSMVPMVWNSTLVNVPQAGSSDDLDRCGVSPQPPVEVRWGSSDPWMFQSRAVKQPIFLSVGFLISFFVGATSFAHLYRVLLEGQFQEKLIKGLPRYDRWVEYAFTSWAMVIVIVVYTGTTDVWVLAFVGLAQSVMCFLGYVVEAADYVASKECHLKDTASVPDEKIDTGEYNNNPDESETTFQRAWGSDRSGSTIVPVRLNMPWQKGPVVRPAYTTIGVEIDAARKRQAVNPDDLKKCMKYLKRLSFLCGMYIFAWMWIYIGYNLNMVYMRTFNCLNDRDLTSYTVFPILIFFVQLIFFLTFPAAQIYFHFFRANEKKTDGFLQEYVYNLLSTTSKAALAGILIAQSVVFSV